MDQTILFLAVKIAFHPPTLPSFGALGGEMADVADTPAWMAGYAGLAAILEAGARPP